MMEQGANGTTCTLCPANTICLSGALSNCTSNAASAAGTSTKCTCNAGFYSVVSGVGLCTQCPAGNYCTGDTVNTACTTNAYSSPQAPSSTWCTCNAGYVVSFPLVYPTVFAAYALC